MYIYIYNVIIYVGIYIYITETYHVNYESHLVRDMNISYSKTVFFFF